MSRTYRKSEIWMRHAKSKFWTNDEFDKYQEEEKKSLGIDKLFWWSDLPSWSWKHVTFYTDKGRDHKRRDKPPKWFKQMHRRIERTNVNQAIHCEKYDNIPTFKKSDQWDWT